MTVAELKNYLNKVENDSLEVKLSVNYGEYPTECTRGSVTCVHVHEEDIMLYGITQELAEFYEE